MSPDRGQQGAYCRGARRRLNDLGRADALRPNPPGPNHHSRIPPYSAGDMIARKAGGARVASEPVERKLQ